MPAPGGPTRTCQSARIRMGRLRVRVIMGNGTCIARYPDTGMQPSRVNRLVSAALGRDHETVLHFIGRPRAFGIGSRLRPGGVTTSPI